MWNLSSAGGPPTGIIVTRCEDKKTQAKRAATCFERKLASWLPVGKPEERTGLPPVGGAIREPFASGQPTAQENKLAAFQPATKAGRGGHPRGGARVRVSSLDAGNDRNHLRQTPFTSTRTTTPTPARGERCFTGWGRGRRPLHTAEGLRGGTRPGGAAAIRSGTYRAGTFFDRETLASGPLFDQGPFG